MQSFKQTAEAIEEHLAPTVKRRRFSEPLDFAYISLVLFTFVYFARPEDWIPGLEAIPLAKLAGVPMFVAVLFSFGRIRWQFPREIVLLGLLIIHLWLTVPFSSVWRGGAFNAMLEFSKVLPLACAIFVTVRSMKRLLLILFVQAISVTAIAGASAVIAHTRGGRLEGVIGGMYGNPNDLALASDLCLPICLAFALTSRSYLSRIAWTMGILTMIYTMTLTASRAGFLSLAAAVLICLWEFGVKGGRGYLLLLAPLAVLIISLHSGQSLRERFTQLSIDSLDPGQNSSAADSAEQRKQLLFRSLEITAQHPLLGIGPGNFMVVSGNWHVSHNSYTQISAEGGIPALALYLAILWGAVQNLRHLQRAGKVPKSVRMFSSAIKGSLGAFLVGSFFSSLAYMMFPYCLVAYTIALRTIVQRERIFADQTVKSAVAKPQVATSF